MKINNVVRNVVPAITVMFAGLLGAYMVYQGFYSDNITAVTVSQYEPAAGDEMVVDSNTDHMMSEEMDHSGMDHSVMSNDHVMTEDMGETTDMEGGMDWEISADESTMIEDAGETEILAEETGIETEENAEIAADEAVITEDIAEEAVAVENTETLDTTVTDEATTEVSEGEVEAETEMQAGISEETDMPSEIMIKDGAIAPAKIEPAAE